MLKSLLSRSTVSTVMALVLMVAPLSVSAAPEVYMQTSQVQSASAEYVSGEVIVKFRDSEKPFAVLPVPDVDAALAALSQNPSIEYVEPNYVVHALGVPNDPLYQYQWHLDNDEFGGIEIEEAWELSTGLGATVAVIDTGLTTVSDGPDCVVGSYNTIDDTTTVADGSGHGTHVANTVAEATNNGIGAAGVAYDACVMPVKVLGDDGSGSTADVADGIRYAVDNGADIINLSLGSSADSQTMVDAVAHAHSNGVTVIAAMGNDSSASASYPAAYDDFVIAVGATSYDEELASYSNFGSSVDVVAPGGEMYTYRGPFQRENDENKDGYVDGVLQQTVGDAGDSYYFYQGTSMASPHVAGVAALVLAYGNAAGGDGVTSPEEMRTALQSSADDLGATGRDDTFGHGIINAHQALLFSNDAEEPINQVPTASVSTDKTEVLIGEAVQFDGTGSSDPDGDALSYAWDFADGNTATGEMVTHTYSATGTYTASLTVSDGELSDTATVAITVREDSTDTNNPPTASFTTEVLDRTVHFTDTSADDGMISSWSWDFGDGTTSTNQNPSHTYTADGTYTVTLLVTDDEGAIGSTAQDVTVTEPIADPAIALTLSGDKDKGRHVVTVNWSGATTDTVDVYRDDVVIASPSDSGEYTDGTDNRGGATYTYKVCEAGSADVCSAEQTISF